MMRRKIKKRGKKIYAFLAVALMFVFLSCNGTGGAVPNSGDGPPIQEEAMPGGDALAGEEEPFTEGQMQEIYDSIKEAVWSGYIEPKGLPAECFEWPGYEVLSNGVIWDEGHAWSYFNNIALNYSENGALYDTEGFMYELPDEDICDLMEAVLDGLANWFKLHEGEAQSFQRVRNAIFPEYEKLPENIQFSVSED